MSIPIYRRSPEIGTCLCQGEILSDLIRFPLDIKTINDPEPGIVRIDHPFALVLTQACDLTQDFDARLHQKPHQLPDVLFCQLPIASALKTPELNSKIWDRIKRNKDERYHFLEMIPSECDACGNGIPELGVDFKRYFTIPTEEVYLRIELGQTRRRSVLCTPFLEHVSSRFAYFLSRVGLPREHISE